MIALGPFLFSRLCMLIPLPDSLPGGVLREELSGDGNAVTAQTISRMRDMVSLGKREPKIRELVGQLAFSCGAKDYYCYARAAHNFCRDEIRYVFDPSGVELIENPVRILETKAADCDSIVILMASICESMGFPCRFVTIKADLQRPDDFSHVFLEVKVPRFGWVGSDPTQPTRDFGWEAGPEYARKTWPASNDEPEDAREDDKMAGLAGPIPGIQTTPGVMVDKDYQFRDEPVLILTTPEQLELSPFGEKADDELVGGQAQDFWAADQLESLPEPKAQHMGNLSAAQPSAMSSVLVLGAVIVGAILLLGHGGKK